MKRPKILLRFFLSASRYNCSWFSTPAVLAVNKAVLKMNENH